MPADLDRHLGKAPEGFEYLVEKLPPFGGDNRARELELDDLPFDQLVEGLLKLNNDGGQRRARSDRRRRSGTGNNGWRRRVLPDR